MNCSRLNSSSVLSIPKVRAFNMCLLLLFLSFLVFRISSFSAYSLSFPSLNYSASIVLAVPISPFLYFLSSTMSNSIYHKSISSLSSISVFLILFLSIWDLEWSASLSNVTGFNQLLGIYTVTLFLYQTIPRSYASFTVIFFSSLTSSLILSHKSIWSIGTSSFYEINLFITLSFIVSTSFPGNMSSLPPLFSRAMIFFILKNTSPSFPALAFLSVILSFVLASKISIS